GVAVRDLGDRTRHVGDRGRQRDSDAGPAEVEAASGEVAERRVRVVRYRPGCHAARVRTATGPDLREAGRERELPEAAAVAVRGDRRRDGGIGDAGRGDGQGG